MIYQKKNEHRKNLVASNKAVNTHNTRVFQEKMHSISLLILRNVVTKICRFNRIKNKLFVEWTFSLQPITLKV